ncbi:hypothetical protein C7434_1097 [Pantoea sp. PNA 14-12]|nr:hypothetical protein HA47_17825 [Pantoea stewartii subsp. indologenes]TDS72288.1 hypothetical protein C7434_1097 [Pantoea sp. PNA 14-12]
MCCCPAAQLIARQGVKKSATKMKRRVTLRSEAKRDARRDVVARLNRLVRSVSTGGEFGYSDSWLTGHGIKRKMPGRAGKPRKE